MYGIFQNTSLDPFSERQVIFDLTYPADYSTACVESLECFKCNDLTEDCDTTFKEERVAELQKEETLLVSSQSWAYETELEYHCAPARAFNDSNGNILHNVTIGCGWDGNWTDSAVFPPCVCESRIF